MAVSDIQFHVLDVGQGSCNYVEIYDEDGDVVRNMLVDLGTNSSMAIAEDNIEWIKDRIEENDNYLDVLIITHGDTDHYNLITRILPAFGDPDNEQIGMVRYGGPAWRYGHGLIDTLEEYTQLDEDDEPDCFGFPPSESSYAENDDDEFEWFPIWEDEDLEVSIQLIIANTPHPRDPDDIDEPQKKFDSVAINTKSVVCAVEWDGWWLVCTGDATATTLGAVNDLLEDAEDLPTTFMLTMPHHGSRKTTYNLKVADDEVDDDAREVVDDFLNIFDPWTASVSAGNKHHHPSMLMVDQFSEHTDQDTVFWSDDDLEDNRHFLTCWIDLDITDVDVDPGWPAMWLYGSTQTDENIYSTIYFKDDPYNRLYVVPKSKRRYYKRFAAPPIPAEELDDEGAQEAPLGRNYLFSIEPDNEVSVHSDENEARARAESPDLLIGARAPPPSFFTSSGRLTRAAMVPAAARPAPPAARAATRSIAEPAGPRLKSLRPIE